MRKSFIVKSLMVSTMAVTLVVFLTSGRETQAQPQPFQVLVLNDLGEHQSTVTLMESRGWGVTTAGVLEVLTDGAEALSVYDAVWIPAQSNYPGLRQLASWGGVLQAYVKQGGTVVLADLSPEEFWIDAVVGGADVEALPAGCEGPVTITAADHPVITGEGTGGTPLAEADLDPQGTGGSGCIRGDGQTDAIVIASNVHGPVLLEHTIGTGHVLICALLSPQPNCIENILLYVQSLGI